MKKILLIYIMTFALFMMVKPDTYNIKLNKMQDTSAQKYLNDLNSTDEKKRSDAAVNLYKMKHPEAIRACIQTINDAEDILHQDYTPSVHCLIKIGRPALPALTDLMLTENKTTRLRAYRAIERITLDIWKKKYPDEKIALKNWKKWWDEINLNYEDSSANREAAVKKLKKWLQ